MYISRFAFAAIAAASIVAFQAQAGMSQSACTQGEREYQDAHGAKWCMDSQGRSYKLDDQKGKVVDPSPAPVSRHASDLGLPPKMRMCAGGHCFTLKLNNGVYDGVEDHIATKDITLSVVKFAKDQMQFDLLHRNGSRAELVGNIPLGADVLIDDDFKWTAPFKPGVPFNMMWGRALACDPSNKASEPAELIFGYGLYAWKGTDYALANCWLEKSSDLGDGRAATLLGIAYALKLGVGQSDASSFEYLLKGAERGNPTGQVLLADLYENGSSAVAVNLDRAAMWRNKAMETEEGRTLIERLRVQTEQRRAQAAAQQQAQADQMKLLGMVFMWVLNSVDSDEPSRPRSLAGEAWGRQEAQRVNAAAQKH